MTKSKSVSVSLGDLREGVEARVRSGAYASISEVLQAGVRALDREEAALNHWMREKICESLDDPRPSIPAKDVFEALERRYEADLRDEQEQAGRCGA